MKLNKYEQKALRLQKRKDSLVGKGLYIYRNNTTGDLYLPRKTKSGLSKVGVGQEFQGDDYYMFLLKTNELSLVKVLDTGEVKACEESLTPINESKETQMEQKLITEQPPVVTTEGTVEFVEKKDKKQIPINENTPRVDAPEVLLTENPLEGIEIM